MASCRCDCWNTARTSMRASTSSSWRVHLRIGDFGSSTRNSHKRRMVEPDAAGSPDRAKAKIRKRPSAAGHVAELHGLGIGDANNWRRVKALADHKAFCQMLVGTPAGQERRTVVRRSSRGVAAVLDEIALGRGRVGAMPFMRRVQHRRPFTIEVDQFLCDGSPFRRVCVQQRSRTSVLQDRHQLPSEIEGVLHRHVHSLPGLRTVSVTSVPGDEHARQSSCGLRFRHIINLSVSRCLFHRLTTKVPPLPQTDRDGRFAAPSR